MAIIIKDILQGVGKDADNAMFISTATNGIKQPIAVLEVAVSTTNDDVVTDFLVEPMDMIIDSNLNSEFTGINPTVYRRDVVFGSTASDRLIQLIRETRPSIIVIKNSNWFMKHFTHDCNRGLFPFFAALGKHHLFPLIDYEKLRRGMDYTLFDTAYFEFYKQLIDHIELLCKQEGRRLGGLTTMCSIKSRKIDALPVRNETQAVSDVRLMRLIWDDMIHNTRNEEQWPVDNEGGFA